MRLRLILTTVLALAFAVPVVAEAAKPPKPAPPAPAPKGTPKNPSLTTTPNPVVFGSRTVVAGQLKGQNNSGRVVTLQGAPHPFTNFNNNVATATTDSAGKFSFTRRPRLHTQYRVSIGGLLSPTVTVLVRQRVSLFLSDRTPRSGQLVRFSGRSCPTHDGSVVSIQKRTSTGSWRTVRRTRLRDASRCSVYSRRLRIFHDGTFRTVVARDADHARGFSRRRTADAHR